MLLCLVMIMIGAPRAAARRVPRQWHLVRLAPCAPLSTGARARARLDARTAHPSDTPDAPNRAQEHAASGCAGSLAFRMEDAFGTKALVSRCGGCGHWGVVV